MKKDYGYKGLIPQEVSPRDDASHGLTKSKASEWWYFEAIFDNDYSVVFSFTTSLKNLIAFPTIEIYKNGEFEKRAIKRYLSRDFQASEHFPYVKLLDKKIIEFDQEKFNDKGEWIYHISTKINNYEVDLTFTGITKGWKFERQTESWIVALPKAVVTGEIVVNGNNMKVNGIGYHDHNSISNLSTAMNVRGWFWGKIASKTLNVSWANIVRKSSNEEKLAVVNKDKQGFFVINPENIHFEASNYIRNHGRKMPTSYTIKIDDVVNDLPIKVDVDMNVKNIHRRFKRLPIAPYWRYHVEAKGYISLGPNRETVNDTQIMEFFRLV